MPIYKHCEECNVIYPAPPYRVRQGKARFCSKKCLNTWLCREVLPKVDRSGEKNGNWKGGISKDNYHYKKLQVERYPERVRARRLVGDAVRTGKLTRLPCQHCGTEEDIQAHHEDYSKPLEVVWLCRPCHRSLHESEKLKKAA